MKKSSPRSQTAVVADPLALKNEVDVAGSLELKNEVVVAGPVAFRTCVKNPSVTG